MIDYNKRLVEVDEILSYLPEEDLLKIPEDIRQVIKENKDKEYTWNYDETKDLKDQNLNRDTIVFLSYLNMEYLLNEEQKMYMQQIYELNEKKVEEEKSAQYNPDDLFKNKNKSAQNIEDVQQENNKLIVYKQSIFSKILGKLKKFFSKNIKN